jgi:hypothetical protein
MQSFKPEVLCQGETKFCGNGLRFETEPEAKAYVHDLMMRWMSVNETRVVKVDEPVNSRWRDGRVHPFP